eukprot:GEMP01055618.1.p1 GENE.GEMP01055618.1~~GEMP01055618.1.p1  ORF type:complete len:124 (+),score=14.63 GEMP01055618.1:816-1187(+)
MPCEIHQNVICSRRKLQQRLPRTPKYGLEQWQLQKNSQETVRCGVLGTLPPRLLSAFKHATPSFWGPPLFWDSPLGPLPVLKLAPRHLPGFFKHAPPAGFVELAAANTGSAVTVYGIFGSAII